MKGGLINSRQLSWTKIWKQIYIVLTGFTGAKSSRPGGVEGGQFQYYQAKNPDTVWILNFSPEPTSVATIYFYTPPPPRLSELKVAELIHVVTLR
jgi:hypothetical protein